MKNDLQEKLLAATALLTQVTHDFIQFQERNYEKIVDASNLILSVERQIKGKKP